MFLRGIGIHLSEYVQVPNHNINSHRCENRKFEILKLSRSKQMNDASPNNLEFFLLCFLIQIRKEFAPFVHNSGRKKEGAQNCH
jgi:hypothetical protein